MIDTIQELSALLSGVPDIIVRTLVTIVLTGFLGAQRQKYEKPAGFKTHIFVGVGAMLTVMVGYYLFESGFSFDITRMPAQVISGIGFLGAGTIFKSEDKISGLTTASTVWVCGSIGVAVGSGYFIGAFVTAGVLFVLLELKDIRRYFFKIRMIRQKKTDTIAFEKINYGQVVELFKDHKIVLKKEDNKVDDTFYILTCNGKILLDYMIEKQLGLKGGILLNCYADLDHYKFEGMKVGYFHNKVALIYFTESKMVKQYVNNVEFKLATGVAMI